MKNGRRMGLKVKSKKVSIGDRGGGGSSHSHHHRSANDATDTDPQAVTEPPPMLKPPVSVVAQGTLTPEEEAALAAAAAAAAAAEEGDGVVIKGKKQVRGPMSVILPPTDQAVGTQTLSQYLNRMRVAPVVRACMLDREHRVSGTL